MLSEMYVKINGKVYVKYLGKHLNIYKFSAKNNDSFKILS